MKIFKINEYDWYMAETMEQAINKAMSDSGLPLDEATDDPRECSDAELDSLMFLDDNGAVRRTFREELNLRIASREPAQMFASNA